MLHAREDYARIQDPLNKIGQDEPVMLFRAQDKCFVPLLKSYLQLLESVGAAEDIKGCVKNHIALSEEWQKSHNVKVPDL